MYHDLKTIWRENLIYGEKVAGKNLVYLKWHVNYNYDMQNDTKKNLMEDQNTIKIHNNLKRC